MAPPSVPAAGIALLLLATLLSSAAASPSRGLLETYEKQDCNKRLVASETKELSCRTNSEAVSKELTIWKKTNSDTEAKYSGLAGKAESEEALKNMCLSDLATFMSEYTTHRTELLNAKVDDEERYKKEVGECKDGKRDAEHDAEDCKNDKEAQRLACVAAARSAKEERDAAKSQYDKGIAALTLANTQEKARLEKLLADGKAAWASEKLALTNAWGTERADLQAAAAQLKTGLDAEMAAHTKDVGDANALCTQQKGAKDVEIASWKQAKADVETEWAEDKEKDQGLAAAAMSKAQKAWEAAQKIVEEASAKKDAAISERDAAIETLKAQLKAATDSAASLQQQLESTQKDLNSRIDTLKDAVTRAEAAKVVALLAAKVEADAIRALLNKQISSTKKAEELNTLNANKIASLTSDLDAANKNTRECKQAKADSETTLRTEVDTWTNKANTAQASADKCGTDLKARGDDIAGLNVQLSDISNQLSNARAQAVTDAAALESVGGSLRATLEQNKAYAADSAAKSVVIDQQTRAHNELAALKDECTNALRDQKDAYTQLDTAHTKTTADLDESKQALAEQQAVNRNLGDAMKKTEHDRDILSAQVSTLEQTEAASKQAIADLQTEVQGLSIAKAGLQQQLGDKTTAFANCDRDKGDFVARLAESERKSAALNGEHVQCLKDNNEVTAKMEHYHNLWTLRKKDLKTCTGNNGKLSERLMKLSAMLNEEYQEYTEIKKDIFHVAAKFKYEEHEEGQVLDYIKNALPDNMGEIKPFEHDDDMEESDGRQGRRDGKPDKE